MRLRSRDGSRLTCLMRVVAPLRRNDDAVRLAVGTRLGLSVSARDHTRTRLVTPCFAE